MAFKKAVREQVKVKILLMGSSGGGKTYTALRLARGIAGEAGRIAFIDTESDRGLYYANEFEYDHDSLSAPYTPERYITKIDEAIRGGYDVLILDSISHEWSGVGGCIEMVDKLPGSNSYAKWAKVTPKHNAFIEKILQSQIHIICTARAKDQYVLEQNAQGKQVPKKVGLGAIQRDGIEYEYTLTLMLDRDTHVAIAQKDNTHMFEDTYEVLTEEHGQKLKEWAESGVAFKKSQEVSNESQKAPVKKPVESLASKTTLGEIASLFKVEDNEIKKLREEEAKRFLQKIKVDRIGHLTEEQARGLIMLLDTIPDTTNEEPLDVAL